MVCLAAHSSSAGSHAATGRSTRTPGRVQPAGRVAAVAPRPSSSGATLQQQQQHHQLVQQRQRSAASARYQQLLALVVGEGVNASQYRKPTRWNLTFDEDVHGPEAPETVLGSC